MTQETAPLIYDIGADRGEDTAFYLALGYRVVAVEPNPESVAHLRERFAAEVAEGRLVVAAVAVGRERGTVTLWVNTSQSWWSTTVREYVERNRRLGTVSRAVEVPCVTLADLIAEYGCAEYIKVDIEGSDMACLEGLRLSACRPRYVSLESSKTSWRALGREFGLLEELGYGRFQISRQGRHSRFDGEFVTVDGRRVPWRFALESSGPFGEQFRGQWLTRRAARRRYLPIFLRHWLLRENRPLARVGWLLHGLPGLGWVPWRSGWYDTHARQGDGPRA